MRRHKFGVFTAEELRGAFCSDGVYSVRGDGVLYVLLLPVVVDPAERARAESEIERAPQQKISAMCGTQMHVRKG